MERRALMRIIEYTHPQAVELSKVKTAMALGLFDGVHIGHRALISETVRIASERKLVPAVMTFPQDSEGLKTGVVRIYSTEEKLRIFEELGIELVFLVDFPSVSHLSGEEFVSDVLCRRMGCRIALAGEDFRFGYKASADSAMLSSYMSSAGGEAIIHKMERYSFSGGESVEVSASLIRGYLSSGEIERACALLGAPYTVRSVVVRGIGLGHTLGFPTVNTDIKDGSPLALGVYETRVRIGEKSYTGLTNVGVCPTFGARSVHAETFILDYSGELYDEAVDISFIRFIRPEREFSSADELRAEIEENIKTVKRGGQDLSREV